MTTLSEWIDTRDWVATGTWIAAGIAAISTAITVWWPWFTRPQPILHAERTAINLSKSQIADLIIACNLQRPTLFWLIRNDGDGVAFNLEVETPAGYQAKLLQIVGDTGITLSSRDPSVSPGAERLVVFYPMTGQDNETPSLAARWAESPIRLKRNHKHRQFEVPGILRGKSHLGALETTLVMHRISQVAELHGYSYPQMLENLGYTGEDIAQAFSPVEETGQ